MISPLLDLLSHVIAYLGLGIIIIVTGGMIYFISKSRKPNNKDSLRSTE